ncbi:polysaccharide deacetylase family protein [Aquimarina intermedia]|uniref:Peptidoglycan/xylan/chitin deacetylase (PgdA/CDA1 family) n=1 Tax=Aquimarina intermedia TaxID=350814 RepID=A0A5S5CDG5_9FLAO|nr:polysaccharide deacetylase family protein [Aquimarina intermedia]TYP76043.1 peptidoglycan/xylan/chitin deacetylase (PgdA/CDA1 family) [Aquimarina intermedia]
MLNKPVEGKKEIFLTFDDGPVPIVTEFVLTQLKAYNAKATFFCVGDNIKKNPDVFKKILSAEHTVGNHTMNHMKAWSCNHSAYIQNVNACAQVIEQHSFNTKAQTLFRPPYGQISPAKLKKLHEMGYKIILWDVLSKDYNSKVTPEQCVSNVVQNVQNGSIVVFHDSLKAFTNLQYALPRVLDLLSKQGYSLRSLTHANS